MKQTVKKLLAIIGVIVILIMTVIPISASNENINVQYCEINNSLFRLSDTKIRELIQKNNGSNIIYKNNNLKISFELSGTQNNQYYVCANLNPNIGVINCVYISSGNYYNSYYYDSNGIERSTQNLSTLPEKTIFEVSPYATINNLSLLENEGYLKITNEIIFTVDINNNKLYNFTPEDSITDKEPEAEQNGYITLYEDGENYFRYYYIGYWDYKLTTKNGEQTEFNGDMEIVENGQYINMPYQYGVIIKNTAQINYLYLLPENTITLSIDKTSDEYIAGLSQGKLLNDEMRYENGLKDGYNNGYDQGKIIGTQEGYKRGYNLGIIEGNEVGNSHGYTQGYDNGFAEGQTKGYTIGYDTAIKVNQPYQTGYNKGYNDGFNSVIQTSDGSAVSGMFTGIFGAIFDGYNTFTNGVTVSGIRLNVIINTFIAIIIVIFGLNTFLRYFK